MEKSFQEILEKNIREESEEIERLSEQLKSKTLELSTEDFMALIEERRERMAVKRTFRQALNLYKYCEVDKGS